MALLPLMPYERLVNADEDEEEADTAALRDLGGRPRAELLPRPLPRPRVVEVVEVTADEVLLPTQELPSVKAYTSTGRGCCCCC